MGSGNRFLAVISVLEGRGFPKRPKHQLIVEAKFDGELLATDPVAHSETPDFNQELAWELDKKTLQQHRLQRSTIKIQCYASDAETTSKEFVGYIVLDLRSVGPNKQAARWYSLLHSRYSQTKAELKLSLYLDQDGPAPHTSAPQRPPEPGASKSDVNVDLKWLVPVLNQDEGFYQIGPAGSCLEQFVLSVTINYASNLPQLIPSDVPLAGSGSGFFFYYSLLGNDVVSEPFFDMVNPGFPAERTTVKLRSSVELLRSFLLHQPGLQIHLCCGDQSLGCCELPLKNLLRSDSTEIYMRPVIIEGAFPLHPSNRTRQAVTTLVGNTQPSVGVTVVLRKEDLAVRSPSRDNKQAALVTDTAGPANETNISASLDQKSKQQQQKETAPSRQQQKETAPSRQQKETTAPDGQGRISKHKSEKSGKVVHEVTDQAGGDRHTSRLPASTQPPPSCSSSTTALSPPRPPLSADVKLPDQIEPKYPETVVFPPQAHHFTFSIDLRSIRDNHSTHTINVYLRYVYPFFGSAAPILTHPPVEIRKGTEVLLPQSFCAFDFACSMQQLQETFSRVPLVVEVWNRDRQLSQDVLVGTAKLPLSLILAADRSRIMNMSGAPGWRMEASDRVPVSSADGKLDKCADISLVLSLEDWGPIASSLNPQPHSGASEAQAPPPASGWRTGVGEAGAASGTRSTVEYQAAVELELWKENQEMEFEKKMKLKEESLMKALAEEWKKRDTEREILTHKKLTEYKHLEDQLRKTLADLERREKKLAISEHEVIKLRADLQREHDRKLQEIKEASRRMKEDCDHQVELQKMKLRETEDITIRCKQELLESEKKYKVLERDFAVYKDNQAKTPEVRLQSEINLLTLEKIELERKLDAATKSKVHYKQQWGRALKDVARLKQKEQEIAKANLLRQKQELEHMRLRYLAAEEKEIVSRDSKELEDIKHQITKLKQMEEERLRNMSDSSQVPTVKDAQGKPLNVNLDASVDEHILRLVEERDTLLRTGVYTTQDKIIAELDRQIREAIAQRSS